VVLVAGACVAALQVVSPSPAYAAAAVPAPAAWWNFNEGSGTTTADSSGNGHTGTLGSGVTWTTGVVGSYALAFSGASTADVSVSAPILNTAASYTVSAWVNLSSLSATSTFVSINGVASPTVTTVSPFYLQFVPSRDEFAFAVYGQDNSGIGAYYAYSAAGVTAGTWYHLVGVDNTSTASLYVNGSLTGSVSVATPWQATGNAVLGAAIYAGVMTNFVTGEMDDVSLYSSALTAAQVAVLNGPAIATGDTSSCMISSGNAYCWGNGANGALGDNSTQSSSVPVPVYTGGALSGVTLTQIDVGTGFACALSSSGAAYCWGLGTSGQLGNSVSVTSLVPVLVSGGLNLVQIAASNNFVCALTSAGAAYCWGSDTQGQLGTTTTPNNVPVAVTTSGVLSGKTLTQIDNGTGFTCVLSSAGAVYCWGQGTNGQLGNGTTTSSPNVPVAVTTSGVLSGKTLTQINLGNNFVCVVSSAGAAYCWGAGGSGQLGNGTTTASQSTAVAVTATGVLSGVNLTQIGSGSNSSCAVSSAGAAYCWGGGAIGQLGNGTTTATQSTAVAVTATGVLLGVYLNQIDVGTTFACVTGNTAAIYCWGEDNNGQVGNGDTAVNFSVPVTVAPARATTIAAGTIHSCEILSGSAYCWGDNSNGELGNGSTMNSSVPVAVYTGGVLAGVTLTQITVSDNLTCALSSVGAAYCWGLNSNGALGNNTAVTSSSVPVAVYTGGVLAGVTLTQITAAASLVCALSSAGAAYCWGSGSNGALGNGTLTTTQATPVAVTTSGALSGVVLTQVAARTSFVCGVGSTGGAYCWGTGGNGQLGNNTTTAAQSTPVAVTTAPGVLSGVNLTQITANVGYACALSSTGAAYCWGENTNGQLGNNSTTQSLVPVAVTTTGVLSGVTLAQISNGSATTCALDTAGTAYCWGAGAIGQLGNGTTTATQSTAVVVTATGVLAGQILTQITGGVTYACALDNAGAAYCWGEDSNGQLGNPATADNFSVPVAVTFQSTMVATGSNHSCLLRDGKAYCWGDDTYGELGNGTTTTTPQKTPVPVVTSGALAGVTLIQITAGTSFTCALSSAGAAYCWGRNNDAQLGVDFSTTESSPVSVSASGVLSGKTLTQISAGDQHTCALSSAGAAYCWGYNGDGSLGQGNTSADLTPVAVVTASTPISGKTLTQVTAGATHSCALDSTGRAYCWGTDGNGQLGDGSTTTATYLPVAVTISAPLTGVTLTQITAGTADTCALDTAGAAFCWGLNTNGQLGNNSTTQSTTAVAVTATATGAPLTQITAGTSFACAVDNTGAAFCWGLNTNGQLGNNSTTQSLVPVAVTVGAPSAVPSGATLFQISAGNTFTCAQDSTGAFYCWGLNSSGQLGNNSTTQSTVPVLVAGIVPGAPTSVAAFPASTTATVYWVAPASFGTGTLTGYLATASPGGATCSTVSALTCTITGLTNGTTYTVTVVTETTDGNSAPGTATVTPWPPVTGIDAASGGGASCTLYSGKAYCWGDNTYGQLGNNSAVTSQLTPVAVYTGGVLAGVTLTQITVGGSSACALSSTGAAYCWGYDVDGELGNGANTNSNVPVLVSGGLAFTQISAGQVNTCALTSTGAAYCWGAGANGQLGNNSTTASNVPVLVSGGLTFTQIAVGNGHACALSSAGAAYCWGSDSVGQLGNNTTSLTPQTTPTAVYTGGALSGLTLAGISAGGTTTCALDSTGLSYCWGLGTGGQLGNGLATSSSVAVVVAVGGSSAIPSGTTLVDITPSNTSTCALASTGLAYCWGVGGNGLLGDNSNSSSNWPMAVTVGSPSAIASGVILTQISTGSSHTCTLSSIGTAYCWGYNANGDLGNNSTTDQDVAVLVGPQAPTGVTAAPGNTTASVSWTAPVYLNNATLTGYTASSTPGTATCSTAAGTTTCGLTGLTDGTTYTVTVTDTTTTGTSAPSSPATVEPVGPLTLTSPSSLTWAVTLSSGNHSVVDAVPADQQLTVADNTGTGAGWHITVSVTTFTAGAHTLPNPGAVAFTGSITSALASTAPTATCVGSCTLPTDTTTYPVAITTAASSPVIYTIYDTSAATGLGVMTIGGSSAANPIGWWLQVPASAYAASYTSTVTFQTVSGP
jgi:alpha-tubulin suppressor-like RCC1 family protein